jgi:predicted DNA binding CopG/RHH family protein
MTQTMYAHVNKWVKKKIVRYYEKFMLMKMSMETNVDDTGDDNLDQQRMKDFQSFTQLQKSALCRSTKYQNSCEVRRQR